MKRELQSTYAFEGESSAGQNVKLTDLTGWIPAGVFGTHASLLQSSVLALACIRLLGSALLILARLFSSPEPARSGLHRSQ